MAETVNQMREQRDRLLALRAENKAQLDDLTARIEQAEAEHDIAERIANLSTAQQSALFQSLGARGIESGEAFGSTKGESR